MEDSCLKANDVKRKHLNFTAPAEPHNGFMDVVSVFATFIWTFQDAVDRVLRANSLISQLLEEYLMREKHWSDEEIAISDRH